MAYTRLEWPNVPAGTGFQALQEILGHLRDIENVDPKCGADDAMTVAHAFRSKIYPGMPDNPVVIGKGGEAEALMAIGIDVDDEGQKQLVVDVIEAAQGHYVQALGDGYHPTRLTPLMSLDWSQLIQVLLPIILKLLEKWLSQQTS